MLAASVMQRKKNKFERAAHHDCNHVTVLRSGGTFDALPPGISRPSVGVSEGRVNGAALAKTTVITNLFSSLF